jgi:MOSC domain-containing protein YiiM
MGRVEHIHIARIEGGPVEAVDEIEVVEGIGVVGDRHALAPGEWDDSHIGEELTLVEAESLEMLARNHDIHLQPGETRRNVTTRGIALNDVVELCEPCDHLMSIVGKPILRPLAHRAGIRVQLVQGGWIRVGDAVDALGESEALDNRGLAEATDRP